MTKPKKNKTIDFITVILILMTALYCAFIFLSEYNYNYAEGIKIVIGILGVICCLMVISMIVELKHTKEIRKIYILYSQEDMPFVSKLYNALKVAPYKILWDKKEIHVGDHIEEKTNQLLKESNDVIFVISKNSTSSNWSSSTIKKITKLKKRILPVLLDDSEPPDELKEIMFADFRSSFDDGYFSLRDALKADRQDKPHPPIDKA